MRDTFKGDSFVGDDDKDHISPEAAVESKGPVFFLNKHTTTNAMGGRRRMKTGQKKVGKMGRLTRADTYPGGHHHYQSGSNDGGHVCRNVCRRFVRNKRKRDKKNGSFNSVMAKLEHTVCLLFHSGDPFNTSGSSPLFENGISSLGGHF